MKKLLVLTAFAFTLFTACGPESSPEGRLTIKTDSLQKQIDELKAQNNAIQDSLNKVMQEVRELK
jgi:hypothetical protein